VEPSNVLYVVGNSCSSNMQLLQHAYLPRMLWCGSFSMLKNEGDIWIVVLKTGVGMES
jgi:hypothetical protein